MPTYETGMLTAFVDTFEINRERAIDYLNTRDNVYVFDGFAGVSVRRFQSIGTNSYIDPCPLVGPQVPHRGASHLRSCLSRSLHGEFIFVCLRFHPTMAVCLP